MQRIRLIKFLLTRPFRQLSLIHLSESSRYRKAILLYSNLTGRRCLGLHCLICMRSQPLASLCYLGHLATLFPHGLFN
ncbi:hypothetical protein BJX66DRAFT_318313 [Aspergillus keveii]|uniref:Uncharacterized protein n=1 Tax=Aspergillus keveii TaxID=714993 RepID=A0ABR4FJZ8_9EURO